MIRVVIPGEPVPKGRPRYGSGRTYTPSSTSAAEDLIRWELRAARVPMLTGDVAVAIRFVFVDRRNRDIDNLVKLVFDACNGFAWRDDAQVSSLHAYIQRDEIDPRTELEIRAA